MSQAGIARTSRRHVVSRESRARLVDPHLHRIAVVVRPQPKRREPVAQKLPVAADPGRVPERPRDESEERARIAAGEEDREPGHDEHDGRRRLERDQHDQVREHHDATQERPPSRLPLAVLDADVHRVGHVQPGLSRGRPWRRPRRTPRPGGRRTRRRRLPRPARAPRAPPRAGGPRPAVDRLGIERLADQDDGAVRPHLEVAVVRGVALDGAALVGDPGLAGLEKRDQRGVVREDAQLARGAGHDEHLGVACVRHALGRDELHGISGMVGHGFTRRSSSSLRPRRRPRSRRPGKRPAPAGRRACRRAPPGSCGSCPRASRTCRASR